MDGSEGLTSCPESSFVNSISGFLLTTGGSEAYCDTSGVYRLSFNASQSTTQLGLVDSSSSSARVMHDQISSKQPLLA